MPIGKPDDVDSAYDAETESPSVTSDNDVNESLFSDDVSDEEQVVRASNSQPVECKQVAKHYQCAQCEKGFGDLDTVIAHMRKHRKCRPFSCGVCEYTGTSHSAMDKHAKSHVIKVVFRCGVCEYMAESKADLIRHMQRHQKVQTHADNTSDKVLVQKQELKHSCQKISSDRRGGNLKVVGMKKEMPDGYVHLSKEYTKPLLCCNKCEYKTQITCDMRLHKQFHLRPKPDDTKSSSSESKKAKEKPFSCQLCSYRGASRHLVMSHMRMHTAKKFACDTCEYRCRSRAGMTVHRRSHTGECPFVCPMCEYRSADRGSLRRHIKVHTEEKPYKCDVCEFRASTKVNLASHVLTHTGEKPYKCDYCVKRFARYNRCRQHMMQVHTNNISQVSTRPPQTKIPHTCDVCEKVFTRAAELTRHMLSHEGEVLHKCGICEFSTKNVKQFADHGREHGEAGAFKCSVCSESFALLASLLSHTRTHQ